ncbi:MAG: hypothetical protein UU47_C0004G0008 [candidate division TM6 bacterium GW2011_GWE2_41_16]|nr:MAG: hypothetical protein UU47_C0004G0008 [candidate division TM6 bacterium GW2011_GWE2_41_16]
MAIIVYVKAGECLILSSEQPFLVEINGSFFMSRACGLDVGDRWVGVAISDLTRTIVRPYTTVERDELDAFLQETIAKEKITLMVVGLPKTMSGTESDQTKRTREAFDALQSRFSTVEWVWCDERLSSRCAASMGKHVAPHKTTKDKMANEKRKEHARAAALILDSYLLSGRGSLDK